MDRAVISPDIGFDELLLQAPGPRRLARQHIRLHVVVHVPPATSCAAAVLQVQASGDPQLDFELSRLAGEELATAQPEAPGLWALQITFGEVWSSRSLTWRRLSAVELLALEHGRPVFPAAVPWVRR